MDNPLAVCRGQPASDLLAVLHGLAYGDTPVCQARPQRFPLEQLRDDERHTLVAPDVVDRQYVRMVEGAGGLRFLPKAPQPLRIPHHLLRQDFDGHVALQAGIPRAIDFSHPPGPQGGQDFIRTESRARR